MNSSRADPHSISPRGASQAAAQLGDGLQFLDATLEVVLDGCTPIAHPRVIGGTPGS